MRAVRQISRSDPKNDLARSSYRSHGAVADVAAVSVCCMYRDERVIFCGECSVLVFCFSSPSYVQT